MDDKENLIKVMLETIAIACKHKKAAECQQHKECETCYTEILYEAGYRKIDKDSTIISKQKLLEIAKDYEEMAKMFSKKPNFTNHTGDPDWN